MRSVRDRIRHAVSFEIIGLAIVTPLGVLVFQMPVYNIGIVGVVSATVATVWNFVFTYIFDMIFRSAVGARKKGCLARISHSILFEASLMALLTPFIAWYLRISCLQALTIDLSYSTFYVLYAFLFNLAYDHVFPAAVWGGTGRPPVAPHHARVWFGVDRQ